LPAGGVCGRNSEKIDMPSDASAAATIGNDETAGRNTPTKMPAAIQPTVPKART
jgi:hypothetical protein